jgi:long-chain acyl-CoA synthetase
LVLIPKPETGLLMDAIEEGVPTFIPAVPPLYARIVEEAERTGMSIRGIRFALSGAMPLPVDLVERWESATGGLLVEGYGLTETSPVVVGNPMTSERRPGSIGVPFPDVTVRIADPDDLSRDVDFGQRGELLVKGPQVFAGYRNLPTETEEAFHDGWFRTGDVVTMEPDGFITVVDRIKEVIITGGFNVYPSEVEEVLRGTPRWNRRPWSASPRPTAANRWWRASCSPQGARSTRRSSVPTPKSTSPPTRSPGASWPSRNYP